MNDIAEKQPTDLAPSNVTNMFDVLQRAASDPNVDPDKIERLYEIMDRERQSEAMRLFNAGMVKVQQQVEPIHKNKKNKQTDSTYADLGSIADAVNKVFTSNGFSLRFSEAPCDQEDVCRVLCRLSHEAGHTEDSWADIPISVTGTGGKRMMTDTHGKGSAFTYGRRYLTLMLANIPTVDDDGNAAGTQVETITEEQAAQIQEYFTNDGDPEWEAACLAWMNIEVLTDLPAKQFSKKLADIKQAFNKRNPE